SSTTPEHAAVVCEGLLDLLTTGPRPQDRICVALTRLVARTCAQAEKIEQAKKILALLKYLVADDTLQGTQAIYQQCLTLVTRLRYQKADAEQRPHVFAQIKVAAHENPGNFALSLLASSLSLKHEDRSSAAALLAQPALEGTFEWQLQSCLCGILTGNFQDAELSQQVPAVLQQGYDLLQAMSACARQQPIQGYAALIAATEGEINTLLPVVDPRQVILSLCTYSQSQRRGDELLPLLGKALVAATRLGDSEFSLSVARGLAASGALANADQRVAQVLTPTTDPEGRLRREWSLLYCYQASAAYKAGDYLKAAQHLWLATNFESHPVEAERLKRFARRMEGEANVKRLLALQKMEVSQWRYSPGRYRFLVHAIEMHPALRAALLQEGDAAVQSNWVALLQDTSNEIAFLHGLAVIYREQALASLARQQPDENLLLLNTLLWSLLLCTEEFWEHFTHTHSTRQDASGQALSVQRANEVM